MKTTLITLILILVSFLWGNAQTYTLEDRWVDCGNNTQLLDPYYSPGVTFTWTGSSKGGKANGHGVATKYMNGKFESMYEGTYRNGIREGKGTFTHMDGSVKTGTFVNGQLTGKGTVKDENGNLVSEGGAKDAFGHVKLAGAGKFVKNKIEEMLKSDPDVKKFMKESGMYVEGLLEIPEVRDVNPGHIVRSGESSAYDANFGKEVGAAAVQLLIDNIHGVTVSHITGNGEIRYMLTKDAIVQRHVNLGVLALHENLGVCFGRKPQPSSPKSAKIDSLPDRIY